MLGWHKMIQGGVQRDYSLDGYVLPCKRNKRRSESLMVQVISLLIILPLLYALHASCNNNYLSTGRCLSRAKLQLLSSVLFWSATRSPPPHYHLASRRSSGSRAAHRSTRSRVSHIKSCVSSPVCLVSSDSHSPCVELASMLVRLGRLGGLGGLGLHGEGSWSRSMRSDQTHTAALHCNCTALARCPWLRHCPVAQILLIATIASALIGSLRYDMC